MRRTFLSGEYNLFLLTYRAVNVKLIKGLNDFLEELSKTAYFWKTKATIYF